MQLSQHQYAVASHGMPVAEKGLYEINIDPYGRKLMPSFVRVPQQGGYHQPQNSYSGLPPPGITHPGGQYYAQASHQQQQQQRRMEASLTIDDNYSHGHSRQDARRQEQPTAAEEKPTGGVSAHLDYDMDEMTEFVGTMAQRLVMGQATPERMLPSYRKFVFQILSSTRLPSSTILLGLVYLRERMSHPQMVGLRQEHIYRLLTIALLLASKFLDDNTFQNKSWSEVTNIPVVELNALEKEWLREIRWNLHIDPEGTKGFSQYKAMWDTWVSKNAKTIAPPSAPIENNVRSRSMSTFSSVPLYPAHGDAQFTPPHSGIMSDRPVQLPPVRSAQQPENVYWGWTPADYSPPSAPESGPTTPDSHFNWSNVSYVNAGQHPPQTGFSRLPPIMTYSHPAWHTHHGHCTCYQCRTPNEGFFTTYGQPITA